MIEIPLPSEKHHIVLLNLGKIVSELLCSPESCRHKNILGMFYLIFLLSLPSCLHYFCSFPYSCFRQVLVWPVLALNLVCS